MTKSYSIEACSRAGKDRQKIEVNFFAASRMGPSSGDCVFVESLKSCQLPLFVLLLTVLVAMRKGKSLQGCHRRTCFLYRRG